MGWTGMHATHYDKNGKVDRKAECNAYFTEASDSDCFKVLAESMRGTVYYAAVQRVKKNDGTIIENPATFGVVILTEIVRNDYFNFRYKVMDDSFGPCYYDCPKKILDLLTDTEYEYAIEWRKKCRERMEEKKTAVTPGKLPIGTKIRFKCGERVIELEKMRPAYQFKRPWWYNADHHTCFRVKDIPADFEIVSKPNP